MLWLTRKLLIFIVFLAFFGARAWALPEAKLGSLFAQKVLPYWLNGLHTSFVGKDDARIAVHLFDKGGKSPVVVLIPGRAEPAGDYAELIYDLRGTPYSIYLIDPRGQGASTRLTPVHDVGHVRHAQDYVDDLRAFFDRYVQPGRRVFILAHSMGANIAARFLAQNPSRADALVMTSPMFKIQTGLIPRCVARPLCFCAGAFGQCKHFAIGQTKWIAEKNVFAKNIYTHSAARFEIYRKIFLQHPALRTGGPSYGWVLEAFRSEDSIQNFRNFNTPTLVLSAGKDQIVYEDAELSFCSRFAARCKEIRFVDAYHHILLESDAIRTPALRAIMNFFADH